MPKSDSILDTEGWKTINWRQIERYVFKLQKRIYAASRCGDIQRVRKLQKTDHIKPISCGGKKEWQNLQLLHRHCHDEKTANDGSLKSHIDKMETH